MFPTENQYSWQPFKSCKKELKTKVKINWSACSEGSSINMPEKIHLVQEPSETLTLKIHIPDEDCYDSSDNYHINIDITLVFDNELHVMSSDYIYEMGVNIDSKNDELPVHRIWKKYRNSEVLEFYGVIPYCHYMNGDNVCLFISRYNTRNELERLCHCDWAINEMLLRNGTYSDISLFVGDKEFRVHKDILSLKSTVFKRMFSHEMSENLNGKVLIEDFDTEVIAEMLFYIYTSRYQHLKENHMQLFGAAHRYNVDGLMSICEEYMVINMNCENIVDILDLATLYERHELIRKAMLFVERHETKLVKVERYQDFLCRNFNIMTVASVLILCEKYGMPNVKSDALEFIKINKKDIPRNKTCFDTLDKYPKLLKEIILHIES